MTIVRRADLADRAERAAVEAFVATHPGGTPFHLPVWGEATAVGCGQDFRMLLAEAGGELRGVVPLTHVRSPLFGAALVSTGFGVGGGVLANDPAAGRALAAAAIDVARELKCPTIEMRGGVPVEGAGWTWDDKRYVGFVRPLAGDDDAELLAIPRKQRADVRKALAEPFEISIGRDRRAMAEHFRVYGTSVRNLGTPVFPKSLFREVVRQFGEDADVLTVRHGGQAVASVLSVYWRGTVYPYWGGGTAAARGLRANERMYFELMRHARQRGCTAFDFGRSKVGTGPAAYKKNWGFVGEPLGYPTWTADGAAPRDASPLNPKYRLKIAAWQKLPVAVANRIGPLIAKGLG
ncbi:FemAB family XrtA/PEP-CTERM system-associated protein [uncultured Sphingomonas sp.]|uniref:FemAB family XrtA/PEP-CTERM system-associated protein n=1 Tax=uncultured Sphingomonas sp. TaxID=158754 RepID=UPI0025CE80E9|nr:FemAB family XrtA/PEP-CTERM system-associated protein [uncultured Sphingomonas sp.]